MPFDSATIDRIVSGVLTQLGGDAAARSGSTTEARKHGGGGVQSPGSNVESRDAVAVTLSDRIVTANVLEELDGTATSIEVTLKAIVTPAAWDLAKERGLTIRRSAAPSPASAGQPAFNSQPSTLNSLLIIVHHTDAVARLWDELRSSWRREFVSCPDDAAKLAIAELARGGASRVVIVAEQLHRAACLANRHEKVKAVAVHDTSDVQAIRTQIRANTWCINPHKRSWFELRRLFASLTPNS